MHGTFTKKQAIALLEASLETVDNQSPHLTYAYQFGVALKDPKRRISSEALVQQLNRAIAALNAFADTEEFKLELEIPVESPILDEMQVEIKRRFDLKVKPEDVTPAQAEEIKAAQ